MTWTKCVTQTLFFQGTTKKNRRQICFGLLSKSETKRVKDDFFQTLARLLKSY
jgi:hypothetical protein